MSLRSRKVNTQPKKSSPLKPNEVSSDTLSDLNKHLETYENHREHLALDNTYAESRSGTPSPPSPGFEDGKRETYHEDGHLINNKPGHQYHNDPSNNVKVSEVSVTEHKKTKYTDESGADKTSTQTKRYRFKNLSHRHQASILDMQSSKRSTFFGFYTLFWVTVAVMIIRNAIYNYVAYGRPMGTNIAQILHRDLIKIGLTDLWMYLFSYFPVLLQFMCKNDYVDWDTTGWIIENLWQTAFLFFFMWYSDYMAFPWIGSVFLLLHSLVLIMKQHSYGFYNGYFWRILRELEESKTLLDKLETKNKGSDEDVARLKSQVDFCTEEINMQSTDSTVRFPANITLQNYFMYSMFPTVVYQIEYPRTDKIRWGYVFEKAAAVFGVMFLLVVMAENYLYPIAMRAMDLRNASVHAKLYDYPFVLMDLVPPFILVYLLVFYIIWDAILNGIAELTLFADREFYGEWWNSITWDQFAKDWNTPVHRFLLRHVYHSSMSALRVSKPVATLLTFLLSSCVHELVMFTIFKKLRGYLLLLQMFQLPLVAISRTRYLRDKQILGNVVFWIGIITGPSLMCSLYLTF